MNHQYFEKLKALRGMKMIEHPFHEHPLTYFEPSWIPDPKTLKPKHPGQDIYYISGSHYICNGCRVIQKLEYAFCCQKCNFYLDIHCAALMDRFFTEYDRKTLEEMEKNDYKFHFSHNHVLRLGLTRLRDTTPCCYCNTRTLGYSYCCLDCGFFIHESCVDEMKEQVNHPFHPQHSLKADSSLGWRRYSCRACKEYIDDVALSCKECNFHLHHSCARERLTRPLKLLNYHQHSLFYFARNSAVGRDFRCKLCSVKDKCSIYRCLECSLTNSTDFHLECIFRPGKVKHESHGCELTLSDAVKGFDSLEYLCDICEEPGNSRHHVYTCHQCNFIAHIGCVISEDQEQNLEEMQSS